MSTSYLENCREISNATLWRYLKIPQQLHPLLYGPLLTTRKEKHKLLNTVTLPQISISSLSRDSTSDLRNGFHKDRNYFQILIFKQFGSCLSNNSPTLLTNSSQIENHCIKSLNKPLDLSYCFSSCTAQKTVFWYNLPLVLLERSSIFHKSCSCPYYGNAGF
jgi:hypothetical protein